jgi:hypothetical protein
MRRLIPIISRINSIEKQISELAVEKRGLERQLECFMIDDDGIQEMPSAGLNGHTHDPGEHTAELQRIGKRHA